MKRRSFLQSVIGVSREMMMPIIILLFLCVMLWPYEIPTRETLREIEPDPILLRAFGTTFSTNEKILYGNYEGTLKRIASVSICPDGTRRVTISDTAAWLNFRNYKLPNDEFSFTTLVYFDDLKPVEAYRF